MKKNKYIKKERLNEELESIKSTFYTKSELKELLKLAISKTWNVALEDIDNDVYGIIVMTYVNDLTKNNLENYNELSATLKKNKNKFTPEVFIPIDFEKYLKLREEFKEERVDLYNVLIGAQNQNFIARKKTLNGYLWGAINFNDEINEKLKEINDKYGISFDPNKFKKKLDKVLRVHPEKILERYDFLAKLQDWRDNTIKKAISLTSDLFLIDELLKPNKKFVDKMFAKGGVYRDTISDAIKEKWQLDENDKSIEAVIDTFLYYLIYQNNGDNLRQLRRFIVAKQYPYIHLPFISYGNFKQDFWERFELDTSLLKLIEQFAYDYAAKKGLKDKKGQDYKDQRLCLYDLLYKMTDPEREEYLLGKDGPKYNKKIDKVYSNLLNDEKYGYGKRGEEVDKVLGGVDVIKQELKAFLCDKNTLVKYDFSTPLEDWCSKLAEIFINGRPRVKLLLADDKKVRERFIACFLLEIEETLKKLVHYYSKNSKKMSIDENYSSESKKEDIADFGYSEDSLYDECGKTSVSYTYTNVDGEDALDDLKGALKEVLNNKKDLEAYNYDSNFFYYIYKIAEHHLLKKISNPFPLTSRITKREQKENEYKEYIVTTKDHADYLNKILKILDLPDSKKYFGINPKKDRVYELQIMIIKEIYVNLTHFTRKEQKEKRDKLKCDIPEFNKPGKTGDNKLRTYERRARLLIKKVSLKSETLRSKVKLSLLEEMILSILNK